VAGLEARAFQRFYHRCLQRLLWARGRDRYVGKSPHFLGKIDDLRRAYPDAHFIYLLRSPYESIPSALSMITTMWRLATPRPPTAAAIETIYRALCELASHGDGCAAVVAGWRGDDGPVRGADRQPARPRRSAVRALRVAAQRRLRRAAGARRALAARLEQQPPLRRRAVRFDGAAHSRGLRVSLSIAMGSTATASTVPARGRAVGRAVTNAAYIGFIVAGIGVGATIFVIGWRAEGRRIDARVAALMVAATASGVIGARLYALVRAGLAVGSGCDAGGRVSPAGRRGGLLDRVRHLSRVFLADVPAA
jgi:hypothetical protein